MSGFTKIASDLVNRSRSAGNELRDGIAGVRKRIAALNAKKDELAHMPPPLETAVARMETWIDGMSGAAKLDARLDPRDFALPASLLQGRDPIGSYADPDRVLRAYLAPVLKKCLRDELEALYRVTPGISDDERDDRASKLDRELLDAELTEESIIREAERAGFPVTRRGDADPRAVLAVDEDLP